jgi:hypothetical protein
MFDRTSGLIFIVWAGLDKPFRAGTEHSFVIPYAIYYICYFIHIVKLYLIQLSKINIRKS